eukprot:gnl/MRDRNA2_/MRDRNA2_15688_c0_seq1.p1 gnl/MRDRNA2_/MRDRNA2_15688_c0~~gnl/MRDRNA2_/MRDRNA2_15688_c0_seq1.p1  ORF type:complete len:224 (+),score=35.43 gnl/MRDRNA2_/MRDRNA2_15688_c0_seq1:122-793(+)
MTNSSTGNSNAVFSYIAALWPTCCTSSCGNACQLRSATEFEEIPRTYFFQEPESGTDSSQQVHQESHTSTPSNSSAVTGSRNSEAKKKELKRVAEAFVKSAKEGIPCIQILVVDGSPLKNSVRLGVDDKLLNLQVISEGPTSEPLLVPLSEAKVYDHQALERFNKGMTVKFIEPEDRALVVSIFYKNEQLTILAKDANTREELVMGLRIFAARAKQLSANAEN